MRNRARASRDERRYFHLGPFQEQDAWHGLGSGCTFANTRGAHVNSSSMGHGVEAFNSGLRVVRTTGANPLPNTFSNLDHGVRMLNSLGQGLRLMVVNDNTFTDNICGVYASGSTDMRILNNDFQLGRWLVTMDNLDELLWGNSHRAIFTTGSYALQVYDNSMAPSAQANPGVELEGIVVGFTQDHNDVVWRNTAAGLDRAFVGEGVSADLANANSIGLQFQCNTNNGNSTNLLSRKANGEPFPQNHTIRGFQGTTALGAGNAFDQYSGGWDYRMTTTYVPVIKYHYDDGIADQEPIYYTVVPGVSEVDPVPLAGADNACDVNPYAGSGGSAAMQALPEHQAAYDSLRQAYDALIDDGDTEALIAQINSTGPQDVADLQARLLEISPFVSTAALQALLEQPAVADTVKLEVCAANPDATSTGGFVQWAETAALQPMEQDGMAALASTWNTTTARTTMEDQLAQRHGTLTLAVHQYLHALHGDTAIAAPDSLRWAWQHLRTNAARYAEAAILMDLGNYAEATAVMEAMPQERLLSGREEAERGRMLTYIDVLQGAMEEGRDPFQLSAAEVQTLLDMVGTNYDRPSVWASNLLCMAYGHCRAPYTGGSGSGVKPRSTPQAGASPLPTALRLHPNPANGSVDMDFLLPGHTGAVYLVVRDAAGRVLHRYQASGEQGRHSWDTRGLAPGLYLVELHRDGGVERTERLVVQR